MQGQRAGTCRGTTYEDTFGGHACRSYSCPEARCVVSKTLKLRFKRELQQSPDLASQYNKLGSNKEKEAFRVQWLHHRANAKARTKACETSAKDEKLSAERSWMTAKQLQAHYKSKATAAKHVAYCKDHAKTHVKNNKMIGENLYLLIAVTGSTTTKKSRELTTSWEECHS